MLTLPDTIISLLLPFSTLSHRRTWLKSQLLLVGAILSIPWQANRDIGVARDGTGE